MGKNRIVEDKSKDMREQLRKERDFSLNLIQSLPNYFVSIDAEGRVLMMNDAMLKRLGYTIDEVIGRDYLTTFVPEPDRENLAVIFENLTKLKENTFNENRVITKEGRELLVEWHGRPVLNEDGTLDYFFGVGIDITEREEFIKSILKANNDWLDTFNTINDAITIQDKDFNIIRANKAAEKLLGISSKEMFTQKCHRLYHNSECPHEKCPANKTLLTAKPAVSEFFEPHLHKFFEMKILPQIDENGQVFGIIHIARDISEHKSALEKIKQANDYLNSVIENSLDCIVICDSYGRITRANKSFLDLLGGYSTEEIIGKWIQEFSVMEQGSYECTTGEIVQITDAFFSEVNDRIRMLIEDGKFSNWESYYLRKDKKIVPVEQNGSYFYNNKGERIGSVAVIRDITERKRAEKEIKEAKNFLENVIENSRDGILIYDETGNVISANTAMECMCGLDKKEIEGKHASELVVADSDVREAIRGKNVELFERGFTSYEARHTNREGAEIITETTTSLVKDRSGNPIGAISILRDITERKRLERQLFQSEKLKSLGELAGGVAHDFNNVLAAILGRVQLLRTGIDKPAVGQERRKSTQNLKRGLEIIERAAMDGAETVRRIQEFSRGRDDDRYFTEVDVNKVIDDAIEFTRVRWKDDTESRGIKVSVEKKFGPVCSIAGSASELREVFTNLINNSLDAMPDGGEIRVKTFMEGDEVVIKFEDTGIGIPELVRDRVFDPFFTTKGVQSTGLGMSVSYGIISRHKGTIGVESVEGRGASFTIKLPVLKEGTKGSRLKKSEKAKPQSEKAHILVIEDEESVRGLLSDILTEGGHRVDTAQQGREGVEKFKRGNFDMVFTDLGMPGMSGWQVAEQVKKISSHTPVALITGWELQLSDEQLRKSGVDLVANKPFQVKQILNLIQEGLKIRDKL